jgi:hypothetical protein
MVDVLTETSECATLEAQEYHYPCEILDLRSEIAEGQ